MEYHNEIRVSKLEISMDRDIDYHLKKKIIFSIIYKGRFLTWWQIFQYLIRVVKQM